MHMRGNFKNVQYAFASRHQLHMADVLMRNPCTSADDFKCGSGTIVNVLQTNAKWRIWYKHNW